MCLNRMKTAIVRAISISVNDPASTLSVPSLHGRAIERERGIVPMSNARTDHTHCDELAIEFANSVLWKFAAASKTLGQKTAKLIHLVRTSQWACAATLRRCHR